MNLVPRHLFNSLLDDFLDTPTFKNSIMKADIFEEDGTYKMEVEIPGVNKEDINIEYDDGYLTISAKSEETREDKQYLKRERFYGEYRRSFYIGDINEEDINANFNDGILNITFPKEKDKNNNKKSIQIE